jgi:hypothetical protein
MKQYNCKQAADEIGCSDKTIRKWAPLLNIEKPFHFWLFSEKDIKLLREHIHDGRGRPSGK